jgi:MATE family multidrug resistance protein
MTDLTDIKNLSLAYSYWVIFIPFISSFCFQFDGIFIGASQTKELRNAMIVSVTLYIVCALFLAETLGNLGLWISLSIFFGLRALSLFFYLPRIYRRITE